MIKRSLAIALAISGSVFAAHASAAGFDPWYQFGFDRHAGATAVAAPSISRTTTAYIGYDVDYRFGSDARMIELQPARSALQLRDALGVQPGA